MKRGTPEHPKTIDLANRLNVPRYVAVGILESLWHFTSEFAPQGNIGKFTDAAIAGHIHWEKTCKELVTSLIEAKWVDKCAKHRLIIHDWNEHADQTVKRWLEKRGLQFLQPEQVTRVRNGGSHASTKLAHASTEKADPPPQAGLPKPLPLPKPEPLPEPTPFGGVLQTRPTVTRSTPEWQRDEQFAEFADAYQKTGAALIDEDFANAFQWCWKNLDFEQKTQRIVALGEYIKRGAFSEPRFIPKPLKFIQTEWKRPILAPMPKQAAPTLAERTIALMQKRIANGEQPL